MFLFINDSFFFNRPGSVIADLELTFSESVSQSDVGALLQEATGDGKLGELEVGDVTVGRPIDSELLFLQILNNL